MEKNQITSTTAYNRHPELFQECRDIIGDDSEKKILSFGCSFGLEVLSLKHLYFHSSKIDGYDIDKYVIDDIVNDHPDLRFVSSLDELEAASYDLIFCLSVLTRNPDDDRTYTFDLFESTLSEINKYIKVGGYICIWNSRFIFEDTNIFKNYYEHVDINHQDTGPTQKYSRTYENEIHDYKHVLFRKVRDLKKLDEYHKIMSATEIEKHIAEAIIKSEIHPKPADYIFVENIFPSDYYTKIYKNLLKSDPYYKDQVHTGDPKFFYGSYDTRGQIYVPEDLEGASTLEFFKEFKDILSSETVFNAFVTRFQDGFKRRFGDRCNKTIRDMITPKLLLTRHRPGYYLGPHTDRYEKVMTCVFYFPENDQKQYLGTQMYEPKEKGFTCKGMVHHDPKNFDKLDLVPAKSNYALIFFRDDRLFHGVEKIQPSEDSDRMNIQFNLWLDWGSSI